MKAVVITDYGTPDVMHYTDVNTPAPKATQVLIRTVATSVNFADVKARYGNKSGGNHPPFIPGLDVAGVIEELGDEVHNLKVGQRVIAFPLNGSYAEYVVANESLTFVIPDNLHFEIAAACPIVSFTAYKLLADVARLTQGEMVLIHAAAGGVGTTASQLAKILGASCVIGTVGNESKFQTALEAGCDHVICYGTEDFSIKVKEITDGRGVDVILDSVAGSVSEKSLQCLANYGRLIHFGNSSGEVGHFQTSDLHSSCRSVLGFSLGTTRKERPYLLRDTANHVFGYLSNGRLKIKVGHRFKLEDAAEAHRVVEGRHSVGKVLLTVSE
ncbi:quinone oxidoreductase family protein [Ferroacidibacillus organovorans]|uniref:Quinone oxidoreductase n=1 Tax=Ferroacidibacillus organovorans TaxID=1765683 RepID=A0A853K9D4_9BACL|nr:quinone oxidoreductase [Ferroacidibacillus organovorans]KYP79809.1 quinone oxidoreductase [Ferroacidibacillus organovorans]OAG92733.1 quinone oxidoreductase [Ferroacidibacillus organovorans]